MIRQFGIILMLGLLAVMVLPVQAQTCSAQDSQAWQTQANNDFDQSHYEEAVAGYTCVLEMSNEAATRAYAYQWRGIARQQLGMLDDAMADINRAIEVDPSRGTAYASRANMYLDRNEFEQGIEDFNAALANGYVEAWVYNNLGYAYHYINDLENAKLNYQLAISIDSEYSLAYSNLSEVNFLEGDLNSTQQNLSLSLEYATGVYKAYPYRNRALLSYIEGDHRAAIDDFTSAIELNTDFDDAYLGRARTYQVLKNPGEYADYLRYIQIIQNEIVDLQSDTNIFLEEPLDMVKGRIYRVSLPLASGTILSVSANAAPGDDVDPLIVLLGTNGNAIMGDDDSGSDEDAVINRFPIVQAGMYTLLITHSSSGNSGQILLSTRFFAEEAVNIIAYQLAIGERAEIFAISNDGAGIINLRRYPSTGFEVLEQLPDGARVTVMNGPYKDLDFVWWQVETDTGTIGWMPEEIGGVQVLFAAIDIGRMVTVNVPELNFRAEPTVNAERVLSLYQEARALLPVIDGPVEADGFTWWKVRFSDGREGWAVERVDDNQTLVVILDNT